MRILINLKFIKAKVKTTKTFFEFEDDTDLPDAQRGYKLEQDFGERMAGTI